MTEGIFDASKAEWALQIAEWAESSALLNDLLYSAAVIYGLADGETEYFEEDIHGLIERILEDVWIQEDLRNS